MVYRSRFLLLFMVFLLKLTFGHEHHDRQKRFVIYPRGGAFKIVIGIGTPIKLGSKQSMAIGWNLQMQYAVPTNVTQLESYPPQYTGKRSVNLEESMQRSDRAIFYSALEEIFDSEGYNGRDCLLRSICENAMDPLAHDANGLYGKIFHIILTPNYGNGKVDSDLDPAFLEAQNAGEFGIKCQSLYSNCMIKDGLLSLFSILDSQIG